MRVFFFIQESVRQWDIRDTYQVGAIMLYTLRKGFKRVRFRAYLVPGSRHFREEPRRTINAILAYIGVLRSGTDRAT